jgi:hypothetical protein
MQNKVLQPLGMTSSQCSSIASATADVVSGHLKTGALITGKYNRFPEHAAAGLWSSAIDLAKRC